MEKNYFGAIEFGALYTLIVIISYHDNQSDVVASCKVASEGFYDGKIVNEEAFSASVSKAISEIYKKYKIKLDEVILVLPNNQHKIYSASVSNKVLTERQIIGKAQIESIQGQIRNAKVNDEEVLVEEVPTLFALDNDRVLRSAPINYQSSILTIKSNVHTLPKNIVVPIVNTLRKQNVHVIGQFLNCSCAALATSKDYELENDCVHIHIGQEVTTISLYTKSQLIKSCKISFGVESLIAYLADVLKIDSEKAAQLFESYFIANIDYTSDVIFDENLNLSEKRISGIVLNQLYIGFSQIKDAVSKLTSEGKFSEDYFILMTGWLNDYEYFIDEFANYAQHKVKDGNLEIIGLNEQAYSNCYGALQLFIQRNKSYIQKRYESEENLDIHNLSEQKTTSNEVDMTKNSKFKDIFDD